MESRFLKDALFAGMTANAFKLGTVLSLGWFWQRISGCTVLCRGLGMDEIDFDNVLTVTQINASEISPPTYVSHSNNTIYFYVIRRVNRCGNQEYTLSAAVKIMIDANGDLASAEPSDIFVAKAAQIADKKIQLDWFYCPIEQKQAPVKFNIYYDSGTGQIDYQNPLTSINYTSRKFYSYQTNTLQPGNYLFAIRTQDSAGTEDSSFARLSVDIDDTVPAAIDILDVKMA